MGTIMYEEINALFSGWESIYATDCYIITKRCGEGFDEHEIEIPYDDKILEKTLEIFIKYYPQDKDKYGSIHRSKLCDF